ncbi:hypothetical protein DFH29DRAFT_879200 [Suillus ampliporus]|nr:hypothetical protein DFH29DRAFT_879200 [Suillus ampliporus]
MYEFQVSRFEFRSLSFNVRVSALGTQRSVLSECQTWCIQAFGFWVLVIDGRHIHPYIGIPIPPPIHLYDTCLGPPIYVTSPYVGASEVATRRQAAADVLQALVNLGYQTEATATRIPCKTGRRIPALAHPSI